MIKYKISVLLVFIMLIPCFLFAQGPVANIVFPGNSQWAGCEYQQIIITIIDPDGIAAATINLTVNSISYDISDPELDFVSGETLYFTPYVPFDNKDTVEVSLVDAEDLLGNHLTGRPREWVFYMDLDRPFINPDSRFPPPDTVITGGYLDIGISIEVDDTTSGLRLGGGTLCMCFTSFASSNCYGSRGSGCCWDVTGSSCLRYEDSISLAWTEDDFQAEDSVHVCFLKAIDRVQDNALTCGPNWVDTMDADLCWDFVIDSRGPRAYLIWPNVGDTIACDSLVVKLTDMSGVDISYGQIRAAGTNYWFSDPRISFIGDSLLILVDPLWPASGAISARMNRALDVNGTMSTYVGGDFDTWTFYIDKLPPTPSNPQPPPDTVVGESQPLISLEITDNVSGVNPSSLRITVNGTPYSYTHAAVSYVGDMLTFNPVIAGVNFADGDTVVVCLISAEDRIPPDKCGPNTLDSPWCWQFYVDLSGPVASLILPPTNQYTACDDQEILFEIVDIGGVDSNSIVLTVEGTVYDFMDHLQFENDTLTFTPTSNWTDGATINFTLNSAMDINGNDLASPISSQFYVDLSPPFVTGFIPGIMDFVSDSFPILEIDLDDLGAGVDQTTAVINVLGSNFSYSGYPGAYTWDGSTLTFDLEATGFTFSHDDTVQVCLQIGDDIPTEYCGPNVLDTCWSFIFDLHGPTAQMVIPQDDTITGCPMQEIGIVVQDASGVDFSTISLWINGSFYGFGDISVVGDTVFFVPGSPWTDGDTVVVRLLSVEDNNGNALRDAPVEWQFVVDLSPPHLGTYNPGAEARVSTATPVISMFVLDEGAGVDTTSVQIRIDGIVYTYVSAGVSWSGSRIRFDCALAGVSFEDGDTVEVCLIYAADLVAPEYCGPNSATIDSCWFFVIDLSGPIAEMVVPIHGAFVGCPPQPIHILLVDPNGVVVESSSVEINGMLYDYFDPEISFSGNTMIFNPSVTWTDGDTVMIRMGSACDSFGNCITLGSYEWSFIMDLSPPYLSYVDPPPFSYISDSLPEIYLELPDDVSGIFGGTLEISINGSHYLGMMPGVNWVTDIGFEITTSALSFPWDDTLTFCIHEISDIVMPLYCGPNTYAPDTCWEYYVDIVGPTAHLVAPDDETITACSLQNIVIEIFDGGGIQTDAIEFDLNGAHLTVADPRLSFENDTLFYAPIASWEDGDTVNFEVLAAPDIAGNDLEGPAAWSFVVDLSPPVIVDFSPPAWSLLSDPTPTITIEVADSVAGVNPSSIVMNVGGTPYVYPAAGLTWNGATGTITFDSEVAGRAFADGDTIQICLTVADLVSPVYCGPNILPMFCFRVTFDLLGPEAHIIRPLPGQYTACSNQGIFIYLYDSRGINTSTLNLVVNSVGYNISAPELSYLYDSLLVFNPSTDWSDGEVVTVNLSGVEDNSGNALSTPINWTFNVDLSPPVISNMDPAPGSTETSPTPVISFDVNDAGSGVDPSTFVVEIAGEILNGIPPEVDWDGVTYSVAVESLAMYFRDGDTVVICVRGVADSPDLCPANVMPDTCWEFYVSSSGPIAEIITPPSGHVSSCSDQQIQIRLYDGNGIDTSTISLRINTTIYHLSDPRLTYADSVLTFAPSPLWSHADTLGVVLLQADDMLGTPLEYGALAWYFYIDLEPPVINSIEPPDGASLSDPDSTIFVCAFDDVAGINPASLELVIGGVTYYSTDVTWLSDTISFSLSSLGYLPVDGEELEICIEQLGDQPDLCDPNFISDTCWSYVFDFRGPQVDFAYPRSGFYTSCEDFDVELRITDVSGVDINTLILEVDGVEYAYPNPALSYAGGVLRFSSPAPWVNGDSIVVRLIQVYDFAGNGISPAPMEWWFGLDFSPPEVTNPLPSPGSIITTPTPDISVDIQDASSGVDSTTITLIVDGTPYVIGDPGISWDGLTLSFSSTVAGVTFPNEAVVEVCLQPVSDRAVLCGVNTSEEYCWNFTLDFSGPTDTMIVPRPDATTACADQEIQLLLRDVNGVDCSSIELRVAGVEYNTSYAGLTCEDSIITFTPSGDFSEGYISVGVLHAEDTLGNVADEFTVWFFIVDLSPPEVLHFLPPDGSISGDSSAGIAVSFWDEYSGVDTSSIIVQVNGVNYTFGSPALEWADSMLYFHPERVGVNFRNNDTVEVCVQAADDPDYCPPNVMTPMFCWSFEMDLAGPFATVVSPPFDAVTSCFDQEIQIRITDVSGIDPASIILEINGDPFYYPSPELSFTYPVLTFTPSSYWSSGDTVLVVLREAEDNLGNPLSVPGSVWTRFVVDLEPPVAYGFYPADLTVTSDTEQVIWLYVADSLSGVDTTSIILEVNGVEYELGVDPGLTWRRGWLTFDPVVAGVYFRNGETVNICLVSAEDSPDLCPPNAIVDPVCWSFTVNTSGPMARILEPSPDAFVACPPGEQQILVRITDGDGITLESIILEVNGTDYTIGPELSFAYPVLTYTPSVPWGDGDVIHAILTNAADSIGNPLGSPLDWRFTVDLSPPEYSNPQPTPGSVSSEALPEISINITDAYSGVLGTSIVVTVDSDPYSIGSGLTWVRPVATITPESLRTAFADGETVEVCLEDVSDNPDYCDPNHIGEPYCWSFTMDIGGPAARIISPTPGSYVACRDTMQQILIYLWDDMGIIADSIRMTVNGDVYGYRSDQVTYTGDTLLKFTALYTHWVDGATVSVALNRALDELGNNLAAPLSWEFFMDLSAPVMENPHPYSGEVISEPNPVINMRLWDELSGLDTSSIILSINGDEYSYETSTAFFYVDTLLSFHTGDEGVVFENNDTVEVCIVQALDTPDYCGPNTLDTCWNFFVDLAAPGVVRYFPPDGSFTSCEDQVITILLTDYNGIDITSIQLEVNSVVYDISSTELSFEADSLAILFEPSASFVDGEIVNVVLLSVGDTVGNLASGILSFSFTVDLAPPVATNPDPPDAGSVSDSTPTITLDVTDALSGVDSASLTLLVNGIYTYTLASAAMTWDGTTITLETETAGLDFEDGEAVEVCLTSASDLALFCPPNGISIPYCWTFDISLAGPHAVIIQPGRGDFVACRVAEQLIIMEITDDDGVVEDSIILMVNSIPYTTSMSELTWSAPTLEYAPSTPWTDGAIVNVELTRATDTEGNGMSSPVSWNFTVDLSAPYVFNCDPLPGEFVSPTTSEIRVELLDDLAGMSDSVRIQVEGAWYTPDDPAVTWDGYLLVFYPDSAGLVYMAGDTIEVCIGAFDTPDWCDPNELDSCWVFVIAAGGPIAEAVRPLGGEITTCAYPEIIIHLEDPEGDDIDASTIVIEVDDSILTYGDVGLTYNPSDSSIHYTTPIPFSHYDTIVVILLEVSDIYGASLASPYEFWFIVDVEPPVGSLETPADGAVVGLTRPDISLTVEDLPAGLDPESLTFSIDARVYSYTAGEVALAGDVAQLPGSTLDAPFSGGDTICVEAYFCDNGLYCPANCTTHTWCFSIGGEGPIAMLLAPPESSFTSCSLQHVSIELQDPNGIDPASIRLVVQASEFTLPSANLDFSAGVLTFTPTAGFDDGEVVNVQLYAADSLGNLLEPSPFRATFIVDISAPLLYNMLPSDMEIVYDWSQPVSVDVEDVLAGVDASSLTMRVQMQQGTRELSPDSVDAAFDGTTFSFAPPGILFHERDTIELTVYASDLAEFCGSNTDSAAWRFVVGDDDTIPPSYSNFTPGNVLEGIAFDIEADIADTSGVFDDSTGPGGQGVYLVWDNDSDFTDGDEITILMSEVTRRARVAPGTSEIILSAHHFITQTQIPPQIAADSFVYFVVYAHDNDFDFDTLVDRASGSSAIQRVLIRSAAGPTAQLLYPEDGSFTSCEDQEVIILLEDPDGLDESTIEFAVDGSHYTPISTNVIFRNDSIIFTPVSDFVNNQVVDVELVSAADGWGNALSEPYAWSFTVDLQGPFAELIEPDEGALIIDILELTLGIWDSLSGVDEYSITITVDGVTYDLSAPALVWDSANGELHYSSVVADQEFTEGDTVCVELITADDNAEYCGANEFEGFYRYCFPVLVLLDCDVYPVPFTPNGDGFNDTLWINYPEQHVEKAELFIFDFDGREILNKSIGPTPYKGSNYWDGIDGNGNAALPGVYLYVVKVRDDVVCKGTTVLAR
ncbi:gliding motility-associated C-terminal domain-containing protein [bacterium]|nr:gliding motility-associated C-terminal domain-containing protein [bacterium]